MKILQVCPRYPPQTGGVETHVRELSERLADRGHEVVVHSADAMADGARRARRNGVEVRRHRGLAPGGAYHVAPGITPAVRRSDADVVHAHNYHALPLLFAATGVTAERFVVTPHYHAGSASPLRDRLLSLYRPLGGWAVRRADAVVAVSDWEREHLHEDFDVDATVIPNGIEIDRFRTAEPETRDRPYLLCVGRLEAYKGIQHVIQALGELPGYELVVVGEGPYRATLEQTARTAGVADRVSFLRSIGDDRLANLYAGAEAYVALSTHESYGLTVGEALAAGTPCLVLTSGALRQWTGRADVVGISMLSGPSVVDGLRTVVERTPEPETPLPDWDSSVERLLRLYLSEE